MPFPLTRERRIRRSSQYRRIYDAGNKRAGRYLVIFKSEPCPSGPRVGITVSGKVGKAYLRNRVKRRIKEALRAEIDPSGHTFDMVFVAKRQIIKASFEEIRNDIRALLSGAAK